MTVTNDDMLFAALPAGLAAAERLLAEAKAAVAALIGGSDAAAYDAHQYEAHGFAWMATYVEALRQLLGWTGRLAEAGRLGSIERLIAGIAFGEYLAQLGGGIAMSQNEIVRPGELGVPAPALAAYREAVAATVAAGTEPSRRVCLAGLLAEGHGDTGLDGELAMVRDQFRRFADQEVAPHAHRWHLDDALIPDAVIEAMSAMGVFGLTIPEAHGGAGLGKLAMAVVSEELSRGYIGVGSLGTRSEIAAELILGGGTPAQQAHWLPRIASGEVLPTAVFTEPDTGSDLGSLRTRAVPGDDGGYAITGAKTWITHAARSDLMTLLARTGPVEEGYRTLSMFLCAKPRGTADDAFPADGMAGSEIAVLGYRGMKEYALGFDAYRVPADALLGKVEGRGFKQLMTTFESARIQTAARAVGVAQNAMELGLAYATERRQFARPLLAFPRVAAKIGWMAVETMLARQLTWFAAREKDSGRRCDVEAGMAKLLAARVAWANADGALQVHGGNGYALEYPISRLLCDARILSIFEGAAEVQAHVIARRLLGGAN